MGTNAKSLVLTSLLYTHQQATPLKKKNQNHEANPKHSCAPWCFLIDRFWTALQTIFKGPAKINQQKKRHLQTKKDWKGAAVW